MNTPQAAHRLRQLLLALFVVSGFAALIYQSIWTQYLGLMLGHAAYAQTLVLILFMGGMALGSWAVSRRSLGLRRLLGAYAGVEALIGALGLAFHPLFVALNRFNLETALPALQPLGLDSAWQWTSAAALVAPQTLLLGATFPLIAAGALRAFPDADARRELGGLYFSNGLGAALGALVATFALLPAVGMPGALAVAAGLNLLLALATAALGRRLREHERPPLAPSVAPDGAEGVALARLRRLLLTATFLSSAASFGYEIGWVRLLNQALGTTLHAFELMLAAFIGGLALGGQWVQWRGSRIVDLVRYAGWVQVAMGLAALLSLPLLAQSYGWVGWLLKALAPSAQGYVMYEIATAVIAMVIMLPAAFFAGMTLPLFTAALLKRGAGERAVGQVYAANTLGAIVGVIAVVHLLIPHLGVSLSVAVAAMVDLAVGLLLLHSLSPFAQPLFAAGSAGLAVLAIVLRVGLPEQRVMAAGVFRSSTVQPAEHLVYFKDGSTATVAVKRNGDVLTIATNGKPDAALRRFADRPSPDELTMVMLGALPLAAHPAPRRVALIGWGSGLSTHTVLGSALPQQVDTIEIEPAMWEGAQAFHPRNERAYRDPRSQVHFEDARRLLVTRAQPYDVLISEPSNPWVSGVASLFTREFYALARRQLAADGVLVQWIHSYQMSDALLAEMVAALLAEFPRSEIYQSSFGDLVLLAHKGQPRPLNEHPWSQPALAAELRRVGLASVQDLALRRIGGAATLRSFVRQHQVAPHSDFRPTVALEAPSHRFQGNSALQLTMLRAAGAPILRALECWRLPAGPFAPQTGTDPIGVGLAAATEIAAALSQDRPPTGSTRLDPRLLGPLEALLAQRHGLAPGNEAQTQSQLQTLALATLGHLDPETLKPLWDPRRWLAQGWQPSAAVRAQLHLYQTVAAGDWRAALAASQQLQQLPLSDEVRQFTALLQLLAEVASGTAPGPRRDLGEWNGQADFLRAWAGREQVCQAGA